MTDTRSRLLEALGRIVGHLTRRVDHLALYPCRVVAQRTDGTLDLHAEDSRSGSPASIPYRTLRGLSVEVEAGARVLLGFEGGDPARPVALLWELGDATVVRVNGGDTKVAREGDAVHAGSVQIVTSAILGPTAFAVQYVSAAGVPQGSPQTVTLGGDATVTLALSAGRITAGSSALKVPGG